MNTLAPEFSARPTDHSQIDLWKLHEDVCFGRAGGKVIWQPRILAWYDDKIFFKQPLPEKYQGLSRADIYRSLGCSDRLYYFNECFESTEDPRVTVQRIDHGGGRFEVVWHTPVGDQRFEGINTPYSRWHEPIKWPIADERDMKIATWRRRHMNWRFNQATYDRLCKQYAGLGAPTMFICRTSIQQLFVEDMNVEPAIMALYDYPEVCEAYFEALEVCHARMIEVINACPIKIINYGDNIHASVTTPDLFRKYIQPIYQRRTEQLHKAGKFVHSHFDGNVKPLLPLMKDCGLDGIEAITPLPQGDVTLEETKASLGDELFLLDGIPAVYFDTTYPEQVLVECAKRCIELFAPKLVLGISDEISATGDIERVRLVGRIVDDYNASLR